MSSERFDGPLNGNAFWRCQPSHQAPSCFLSRAVFPSRSDRVAVSGVLTVVSTVSLRMHLHGILNDVEAWVRWDHLIPVRPPCLEHPLSPSRCLALLRRFQET